MDTNLEEQVAKIMGPAEEKLARESAILVLVSSAPFAAAMWQMQVQKGMITTQEFFERLHAYRESLLILGVTEDELEKAMNEIENMPIENMPPMGGV